MGPKLTLGLRILVSLGNKGPSRKGYKMWCLQMVVTYKDWAEKLPFALWGYRTSIRASTKATPYTLVYGSEAILPIEV